MKKKFRIYWSEQGEALFSPINEAAEEYFFMGLWWEFQDKATGQQVKAIGF